MGVFSRVEADRAGPDALGILVPPSRQTFLILRARNLPTDLVLTRDDDTFQVLTHDEASAAAQAVYRGLCDLLATATAVPHKSGLKHLVLNIGPYRFLACPRLPGKPYAALTLTAEQAAAELPDYERIFRPTMEQEIYFNTRFFERPSPPTTDT